MVYKTHKLSNGGMRKLALRHSVIFWVLMVAVYYLMEMAESGETMVELDPWVVGILVLPALALAVLGLRRMLKFRGQWENLFFTLTEGGVLYESEHAGMHSFIPWSEVSMARRSGSMVYLYLKSGQAFPCVLEGISEPRQREFFRFALDRAGKGSASDLTPPPAEAMVGEPLRYSATRAQRREVADAMVMAESPARVRVYRPLLFVLWTGILAYSCYESQLSMMVVSFVLLLSTAYLMWHPGIRYNRRNEGIGVDVYVNGNSYLALRDNGLWFYAENAKVTGAAKLQYSDFYAFDHGGYLALDRGQPRPPQWPETCGKLRRRRSGATMILAVLISVLLALLAFSQSRLYHFYNMLNDDEPRPHVEALAGVALTEAMSYEVGHNFVDTTLLKPKRQVMAYAAWIVISYPNDEVETIFLDGQGREMCRRTQVDFSGIDVREIDGGEIHLDENGEVIGGDTYGDTE